MKVIDGDVDVGDLDLYKLPDLSDVQINGDFHCDYNNLTSLVGCPVSISGEFRCSGNSLTNLGGAPNLVGGNFYCYANSVVFTAEDVRKVCKVGGTIYV